MRCLRHYLLFALLLSPVVLLFPVFADACVYDSIPVKIRPRFTVHVYNELGPVEGLKLKIVALGSHDPLAETTTDGKGIGVFQLQTFVRGGALFLQPEHNVIGWQWPEIDVEADAGQTSLEIEWPSQILRTRDLHGTIQLRDFSNSSRVSPLVHASLSLRSLVSYKEIATAVTDEKGAFQFAEIQPGLYYLQLNGKNHDDPSVPMGDIPVHIGKTETNDGLSIITRYSDCGLYYELQGKVRR